MKAIAGLGRTAMLLLGLVCVLAAEARADWLIMPFAGGAFGGDTTFIDLEQGAGSTTFVIGGAGAWLSEQVLGVEGEFAYAPSFFERGDAASNLLVSSNVFTLSGNVIAAMPLAVTQYSLRPYVTGGLGLMHAAFDDVAGLFGVDSNLLAMNVGGGAIGFVSPRTGIRFELRHFRSLNREDDPLTGERRTKLRFWRATVGVVFRY